MSLEKCIIGLHLYFCVGESSRICVTPVSPEFLQQLADKGVALYDIDAQTPSA